MTKPSHIDVRRAAETADEAVFLNAVMDDLTNHESKIVYADWLEDHGETVRAAFLRQFATAFQSQKLEDFPPTNGVPMEWSRMIGAKLARAIVANGASENRDAWMRLARPALIYETEATDEADIPIGGTKFFGCPDLPVGMPWPKQKDCAVLYDNDSGIEPETHCGFVGQINLKELAGTQVARHFPNTGLLSIFSCAEIDSIGMVDGCVLFFPDSQSLARATPPSELVGGDADEANELAPPQRLTLSETLELPCPNDDSPFEAARLRYNTPIYEKYHAVLRESDGNRQLKSLFGYTRSTTGDDPLPGREWCKLICVENTIEMVLHICIRIDDLSTGRFDRLELAFVDFD